MHVFALKDDLKSPKKKATVDKPTIQSRETIAEYYSICSYLNDNGSQVEQQPKKDVEGLNNEVRVEANWNEFAIPDKELLERTGSDSEEV